MFYILTLIANGLYGDYSYTYMMENAKLTGYELRIGVYTVHERKEPRIPGSAEIEARRMAMS